MEDVDFYNQKIAKISHENLPIKKAGKNTK